MIVTLNGETARSEMKRLEEEIKKYEKAAEDAFKAGDKALGNEMRKKAEQLKKEFKVAQKEMKDFSDTIKNLDSKTINELRSAAKQLESQIRRLSPASQEYAAKSEQLKQVRDRIKSLESAYKSVGVAQESWLKRVSSISNAFLFFGQVGSYITGLSMKFRQCAEDAAKLDDVYADVMKTTGLLHDEVAELDKELMKIDTRTSREQLLLLARDAGKLGIEGKENILGFVRAADQIQVALGEDLGEGAIRQLGKIADVLGYTKSMGIEQALLSIGSAINAVGQDSTASEAYLVEFTQRLAGVGAQAGLSAADLIGFASGLDQSAMKVEMASTAFQKFLMKMYEDPAQFASYAKMEVQEFTDLLKNDANTAITTVLKSLKDQDGFAAMVPIFKDMGLDGARAVSVLASMASNLDAVTEAQSLANVEFAKATSLSEEYATKNNNLQAELEKERKEFHNASIALGQSLNPILLKSTKGVTYLIKALANYGKEIKTVLIVIAALTVALKAKVIWQKAVALWNGTLRVRSLALSAAQALLTGNITRATAAWTMMNTAMKASIFGLVTAAVSGLVIWIQRLAEKHREAAAAAQWEQKVEAKATEAFAEESAKVSTLTRIIENNNLSLDQRRKALEELKKIVPDYHADLTDEGILINNNRIALDNYTDSLKKNARVKARQDDITEREVEIQKLEDQLEEAKERERKAEEALTPADKFAKQNVVMDYDSSRIDEADAATEARQKLEKELEKMNKLQDEAVAKLGAIADTIPQVAAENADAVVEATEEALKTANTIITQGQFQLLEDRYSQLTKKEKEMVDKGYEALSKEESEVLKRRYDRLMASDRNLADRRYNEEVKSLEKANREEENALKISLRNREISQEEYNARIKVLDMQLLQEKIKLAQKYGKDETQLVSKLLDEEIKLIGDAAKEIDETVASVLKPVDGQIVDEKAYEDFQEKILSKAADIRASIAEDSAKKQYEAEVKWTQALAKKKIITEEEAQKHILQLKLQYAEQAAQKVSSLAEQASNFVSAVKEAETAKMEAEYQKQLTAAGDNAEKREQIDAEYEQKKLDLQKKYADVDMGINIAKTIANGAGAAIKAWMELGPIGGPIMAGVIAATTAAEVATIVAQRNAIKNSSVNNATSGNSTGSNDVPIGNREITGYAEGGFTENHTTLTTVGERGTEWVSPHWMVKENPVLFANLERYRKTRSQGQSGSISRGFAEGGFTGKSTGNDSINIASLSKADIEAAVMSAIITAMEQKKLYAIVQYGDILVAQNTNEFFNKQTSRS